MSVEGTILSLETSGRAGSLAIRRPDGSIVEQSIHQGGRRHAQSLAAEVKGLLRAQGLKPEDVETLAVSVGPGSFTGLRVGVVFAKTWAYATGCRLAAIETHGVIACNSPADIDSVWVLTDAQRGDVYASHFVREMGSGLFVEDIPMAVFPAEEWLSQSAAGKAVSGPGADFLAPSALAERGIRMLPEECRTAAARWVAELAARSDPAAAADPWTLEPFYFRKPAAVDTWDAAGRP